MGKFIKGDIVVISFPFSNLSQTKKRPALVVSCLSGSDVILCQITSQATADQHSILLEGNDLADGALMHASYIRPARIFTADTQLILYRIGHLKLYKIREVIEKIIHIIQR